MIFIHNVYVRICDKSTQVEFPDSLSPAAVEALEKVLPGRPVTEFDGEEEESMLEVRLLSIRRSLRSSLV